MKKIPLTQGYIATVDDEDYSLVSSYRWMALVSDRPGYVYAVTRMPETGRHLIRMHRFICGLKAGDQREVDHKNGDTLDYRRSNLRICSHQQNGWNHSKRKVESGSKFTGVVRGYKGCWMAQFQYSYRGKRIKKHLGSFKSEIEAAQAFDNFAKQRRGEFARPNLGGNHDGLAEEIVAGTGCDPRYRP